MNAIRLATIVMLSAAPAWACAQSAQTLSDGKSFAESIAPQTQSQIVNPSGVNQTAWSAGSMAVPSSMPAGLGAFSSPLTSSPLYDVNGAQGALSGLGNARIQACKNYVPTGDPIADQECAAVKFMNKDCVLLSSAQLQVVGSAGATAGTGTNCAGTYGSGQSNFGYQNAITTSDPIFHLSQTAQAGASAVTTQNCVSTPVVTTPAQYETNTCSKTVSTDSHTCTQELAVAVTTSYNPANIFYTCAQGNLQGSYCVSSSSVAASVSYSCASGSLSGSSCLSTSGAPASVSYSCPTGTLSGTMCVSSTGTPASVSYSCPGGGSLSGSSCISQTTQPASVYYSCGTGSYPNGNTCYSDSAAQVTESCPPGVPILKGQNGQPDLCVAQYYVAGADCNAQVSGGGYIEVCTWPAPKSYSCPSGAILNGSTCTTSTTATLNYKCDSGTLSGGNCVISSSAPATPVYSCGSGTLSGSQCITSGSTPANAMYYCNSGTLSGTQCLSTSSTPATANYYCPSGAVLNGQTCVTTTQANATVNYSCPTGSTPVGSQCKNVLTQTQWLDNCVPYEQSAGITLGAPK